MIGEALGEALADHLLDGAVDLGDGVGWRGLFRLALRLVVDGDGAPEGGGYLVAGGLGEITRGRFEFVDERGPDQAKLARWFRAVRCFVGCLVCCVFGHWGCQAPASAASSSRVTRATRRPRASKASRSPCACAALSWAKV